MVNPKNNKDGAKPPKKDDDDLTRLEDLSDYLHQDPTHPELTRFDTLDNTHTKEKPLQPVEEKTTTSPLYSDEESKETEETAIALPDFSQEEPEHSSDLTTEEYSSELTSNTQIDLNDDTSLYIDEMMAPSFDTPQEEEPPTSVQDITRDEDLSDVKNFAENMTYGKISLGGNPPFSLLIKGITSPHDAKDIEIILKNHGLIPPDQEETFLNSLSRGAVLVSHLSEYSAIYLGHKLRRFNVNIQIGISRDVHPSQQYNDDEKGSVDSHNLEQNKFEYFPK
ncbi:MAG: hypothetical protein KBD63_06955 [Bacteriovoracaceae bacterium]|nr:hypothetical protein [Bacteriovoracaceae bacterium]